MHETSYAARTKPWELDGAGGTLVPLRTSVTSRSGEVGHESCESPDGPDQT